MQWKYESPTNKSTGYEDVMDYLESFTREKFKKASKAEQDEMINEVYQIYRERDIFPITYFNKEGIREEIQKGIDYEPEIKNGIVNCGAGVCTALCHFMFPNLFEAYNQYNCYGGSMIERESGIRKFHDEHYFKRVIFYALNCDANATPKSIRAGFRQVGTLPSNFRPMNAKALYERYCPENGVIYDYCAGFGGRMTGALTSKKHFYYVACEPNTQTYINLNRLGKEIEEVTGRTSSYKINKIGSEDFRANPEIFDFAFSSPPYFDLEVYSEEKTQCYNRYPDIYVWLNKFVKQTIENIYYMLKPDRYYAVNIADFDYKGKRMNYVYLWKEYSINAGFKYHETLYLKVPSHGGNGELRKLNGKIEQIMVFKKD
jgi:hypothetical protein